MDYDISDVKGCALDVPSACGVAQHIDAAAIFLNTLKAFDEADRLENQVINDDFSPDNEESFLPSLENILAFSSYIKENIEFILGAAGLSSDPPFEIDIDERSGGLVITGEREDVKLISRLINKDAETRDGLVTLLSIADQTYQLLESIDSGDSFPEFVEGGKVIYLFGEGYLSLYKEHKE